MRSYFHHNFLFSLFLLRRQTPGLGCEVFKALLRGRFISMNCGDSLDSLWKVTLSTIFGLIFLMFKQTEDYCMLGYRIHLVAANFTDIKIVIKKKSTPSYFYKMIDTVCRFKLFWICNIILRKRCASFTLREKAKESPRDLGKRAITRKKKVLEPLVSVLL